MGQSDTGKIREFDRARGYTGRGKLEWIKKERTDGRGQSLVKPDNVPSKGSGWERGGFRTHKKKNCRTPSER